MALDATQLALCEAAIALISEGFTIRQCAKELHVRRSTLHEWLSGHPETSGRYARARDCGWDAIADELFEMSKNSKLGHHDRRVQLEAGLKLLARWCPERYGEALLLKHEDVTEREQLTNEDIVRRLALVAKKPVPLQLTHDIQDAEFTDAS